MPSATTLHQDESDAYADDPTLPEFPREGRILVAEDDPAMRELFVQILHVDGRRVVQVASGDELIHAVKEQGLASWPEEPFDVIVTDQRMPNGSGLEVVERLRLSGCTTPVLLVSAFVDGRLRTRAHGLGTVVLSKPFPLEDFRAAVEALMSSEPTRSAQGP